MRQQLELTCHTSCEAGQFCLLATDFAHSVKSVLEKIGIFIKELNPSLFLISQTPLLILRISRSEGLKQ
jgi:hypothetical protein